VLLLRISRYPDRIAVSPFADLVDEQSWKNLSVTQDIGVVRARELR